MNKRGFWLALLAFVVVLGGAYVLYGRLTAGQTSPQLTEESRPAEGMDQADEGQTAPEPVQAPDFTVYDGDGNAVRLTDYFGKPIVLNFWATWCGYCKQEMPDFEAAYQELGEGVQFLMVNATGGRETVEIAKEYIAEQGFTFPVVYDMDMEAVITYGATGLPYTLFIDAGGYPVAQARGAINADLLRQGIDMIYTAGAGEE